VRARRALVVLGWLASVVVLAGGCGLGIEGTLLSDNGALPGRDPTSDAAVVDGVTDPGPTDAAAGDEDVDGSDGAATRDGGDAGGPCSDPSLVLCMRFEDDLTDEAHAQTPIVAGTPTFITGKSGKAVLLGASTSIHIADNPAWTYTTLTYEAWIRPDAIPAAGARAGLLDKDNSFGVFLNPGGIVSCVLSGTASANVAVQGQWVHIACVDDGTTTKLYADGIEKVSVSAAPLGTTTAVAAIGGNSPSGDPLTGAMDTLRVYARARSAAEIAAAATP
jgi:hypothetical protein